ncbi:MAG: hypothetical protein RMN51_08835 [Verrucomicrobiota bacterium]|nr:hypothetical protein [Verrucomicrobiota bacterium]
MVSGAAEAASGQTLGHRGGGVRPTGYGTRGDQTGGTAYGFEEVTAFHDENGLYG